MGNVVIGYDTVADDKINGLFHLTHNITNGKLFFFRSDALPEEQ